MADEPDAALTGAAFDLVNAGYAPMPDLDEKHEEEEISGGSASLRELAEQRSGSRDDVTVREYLDHSGKPVAANEAITLERAGRDYASASALDKLAAENETSKALAARVDALRAEALANDPDAAEFYGFEPPEAKADSPNLRNPDRQKSRRQVHPGTARLQSLMPRLKGRCNIRRCFRPSMSRSAKSKKPGKAISTDWQRRRKLRK